MQRVRWLLLLVLAASPIPVCYGLTYTQTSITMLLGGYIGGFASWTQANVDVQAIRQWSATAAIDPAEEIHGLGGCVIPREFFRRPIARIPVAAWPQSVVKAKPQEVHILGDRSATILAWPAGHAGYARMVVIMADANSHPLDAYILDMGQGVWLCVRGPT
jgi:hypothetical protein